MLYSLEERSGCASERSAQLNNRVNIEYITMTQPACRAISVSFSTGIRISHSYDQSVSAAIPDRHTKIWNNIKTVCKDSEVKFVHRPNSVYTVIFIPMFVYWDIYKNEEVGQDFLLNTVWRDAVNNLYEFAHPEDYFSELYDSINEKRGLYGIYDDAEEPHLLYLGYSDNLNNTFNKLRANWKDTIEKPCKLFSMYKLNEVSFIEILTEEELLIVLDLDTNKVDKTVWEAIRYSLKKMLSPKFKNLKIVDSL